MEKKKEMLLKKTCQRSDEDQHEAWQKESSIKLSLWGFGRKKIRLLPIRKCRHSLFEMSDIERKVDRRERQEKLQRFDAGQTTEI